MGGNVVSGRKGIMCLTSRVRSNWIQQPWYLGLARKISKSRPNCKLSRIEILGEVLGKDFNGLFSSFLGVSFQDVDSKGKELV